MVLLCMSECERLGHPLRMDELGLPKAAMMQVYADTFMVCARICGVMCVCAPGICCACLWYICVRL